MKASSHYRELTSREEAADLVPILDSAWQNPAIPALQHDLVLAELEAQLRGRLCNPYRALIDVWSQLPPDLSVLEIGASSGFNKKVLETAGFLIRYTGLDFSPTFVRFARELDPNIDFRLGDARALPFPNESFDVALSAACLMHIFEYRKAFAEVVRVARRYVVLHRTPIQPGKQTRFYVKDAYGVPCLEMHFSESELLELFEERSLKLIGTVDVFRDPDGYAHRDYILEK